MKYSGLTCCLILICQLTFSQTVSIVRHSETPQTAYASGMLEKALLKQGWTIKKEGADYVVDISLDSIRLKSEAYAISPAGGKIAVTGGDQSGIIYGCLSIAEDLRNGIALQKIKAKSESPNLPFRAIKFNLPWDSYKHSAALSLHYETCKSLDFWEKFLDMMAENRFNAISLWNLHPFTYMIKPKNFPEASPFNEQEMKQWQDLYRNIFRMAKERGIETYIVNWNIFVSPEMAKAYHVALDNLDHNNAAIGDTSEIVKRYTKECVTQVLEEYPDLTGLGFSHGDGMAGMTPQQRQDWFKETIIEGMRVANRKAKLIHRMPFSATTGNSGGTSVETEQITRNALEELDFLDGPVLAEIKFNWSHFYSSTDLIKVHGGKLYDTYFKPEPKNYKIIWMARNEDFYCLRWGVPSFIREHIVKNKLSYVGGYFMGSETYIPAKDYFTKDGTDVDWTYAFQRQWLMYKLWGRLLYNVETPDSVFSAEFTRRYGERGQHMLEAYSLASSTALRIASSFDYTSDPTFYTEGMMGKAKKSRYIDYISVEQQIDQPPTDPNYVSIADYTEAILAGKSFAANRITPPILADMLERDCNRALQLVENIKSEDNNTLMYEIADVKVWANLGLHLAEKLRGGVALQTYRLQGGGDYKKSAVQHLEKSLRYWDVVSDITGKLYNEYPLVQYSERIQKGYTAEADTMRFHWKKFRPLVAADVDMAKRATINLAK